MADDRIAATLAAALIQAAGREIETAKKKPAEVAVEIYFQVVDALAAASKNRGKSASEPYR